jgi:hypothetical protein
LAIWRNAVPRVSANGCTGHVVAAVRPLDRLDSEEPRYNELAFDTIPFDMIRDAVIATVHLVDREARARAMAQGAAKALFTAPTFDRASQDAFLRLDPS